MMGQIGRERVTQLFSWEQSKKELLDVYERAVNRRPRTDHHGVVGALRARQSMHRRGGERASASSAETRARP